MKAQVLNDLFASVFTREDLSNLPAPETYPSTFKENLIFDQNAIAKCLGNLKDSKSPGPDDISAYLIKHLAKPLNVQLYFIFEQSLVESRIPEDWRRANVTPIFKKGDRRSPGNYRPVSLTSIICKVMEQFVRRNILNHMLKNEFKCQEQHGFLNGKSCITNLLETIDDWTSSLDAKKQLDTLYLDFRKAFDTVPHARLLT